MVKKALPLADVEKLIDKGAQLKNESTVEKSTEWTNINIRIPRSMIREIDLSVKERVGITRTGWILEAIHEKLKGIKH